MIKLVDRVRRAAYEVIVFVHILEVVLILVLLSALVLPVIFSEDLTQSLFRLLMCRRSASLGGLYVVFLFIRTLLYFLVLWLML